MAATLTEQVLLEGAWHALAQAGRLLNSAFSLFQANDASTALAIAMFGREELGRSRLLRDCAREVREGFALTVHDVRNRCEDHVAKQSESAFCIVLRPPMDSALGRAMTIMSQPDPSSREWQDAKDMLDAAIGSKQKRQPQQRHDSRCNALYVDLNSSGTGWHRPTEIAEDDARNAIQEALNDYRLERERLTNPALAIANPVHVSVKDMTEARARMAVEVDLPPAPLWL
jgi:AbiV family abortive infection protein